MGLVPEHLKRSPNTKMFLRSFWFRAALKEVVHADEMHIYTLARWAPGPGPPPRSYTTCAQGRARRSGLWPAGNVWA